KTDNSAPRACQHQRADRYDGEHDQQRQHISAHAAKNDRRQSRRKRQLHEPGKMVTIHIGTKKIPTDIQARHPIDLSFRREMLDKPKKKAPETKHEQKPTEPRQRGTVLKQLRQEEKNHEVRSEPKQF